MDLGTGKWTTVRRHHIEQISGNANGAAQVTCEREKVIDFREIIWRTRFHHIGIDFETFLVVVSLLGDPKSIRITSGFWTQDRILDLLVTPTTDFQ
jgi:hypothetical protein